MMNARLVVGAVVVALAATGCSTGPSEADEDAARARLTELVGAKTVTPAYFNEWRDAAQTFCDTLGQIHDDFGMTGVSDAWMDYFQSLSALPDDEEKRLSQGAILGAETYCPDMWP